MVKRNDRKFDIRVNRALIKTCVTTLSTCFSPETEEKLQKKSIDSVKLVSSEWWRPHFQMWSKLIKVDTPVNPY